MNEKSLQSYTILSQVTCCKDKQQFNAQWTMTGTGNNPKMYQLS
jgi:hypothetical protein